MNPPCTVTRQSNSKAVMAGVAALGKRRVLVGIPEATAAERAATLLEMAGKLKGTKGKSANRKDRLLRAATREINNAELLWIQSKGSPVRGIPPRPVLEPSIVYPANRNAITPELAAAAKATLAGDTATASKHLKKAGIAGQRAAQGWFVNPANGWAANAPSTIAAKGSARPLIDHGALRQAITYVVEEG